MVWPFEVQGQLAAARGRGELGIAFFEYWLAVPANRWGSAVYTPAQLRPCRK